MTPNIVTYGMSDDAIQVYLGLQMKQMRLNARMSQKELAERAGVARSTITSMENGKGGTVATLIALLRHLQKLNVLDVFATEAPQSPLAIARNKGRMPSKIYKTPTFDTPLVAEPEW